MAKQEVTLERRFELGASQKPLQPQEPKSELKGFVDELQNPSRFVLGSVAFGVFLTLVLLPVGLIALPVITGFMRFLGF